MNLRRRRLPLGRRSLIMMASLCALLAYGVTAGSGALPSGFQETTVFTGLTNPTAVEFAPDGRVFVAEKSGVDQGVRQPLGHDADRLRRPANARLTTSGTAGCSGSRSTRTSRTTRTCTCSTRTTRRLGGYRAALGYAGGRRLPDASRGRRPTAASSRGRLSRLTATATSMTGTEQVLIDGLVPAVPEPLDRRPRVRPGRRAVRQRRRRRELQLRRLRPGRQPR